jgi:inner membrane protein
MDPITHTLTGVAIGRTGVARTTPLAMAALMIGANLPDVDIAASFAGADASLGWRRGWSHGPLGLLLLPLVLIGCLWGWRRLTGRPGDAPIHYGKLTLIAYGAALTHPLLDWLNTYGVRLFMPFSGEWYYGDAVFIVDPWLWLVLAGPALLASSGGATGKVLWAGAAVLASVPIVLIPFVPPAAIVLWFIGVAALVLLRRSASRIDQRRFATASCVVAAGFIGLMLTGTGLARRQVAAVDDVPLADVVMAGPVPANPLRRQVITALPDGYAIRDVNWVLGRASPRTFQPIGTGPEAEAAAVAPAIAGFMHWARFPTYRVRATDDGVRVDIVDVRYGPWTGGFGSATVWLDDDGRPLRAQVN